MENPFIVIIEKLDELEFQMRKILKAQEGSGNIKNDELMNVKQVADFIDQSVQSIYSMTSLRTIPFIKKGRKLLFNKGDILDWLESKKKKTVEQIMESA